jgi:hypothetical protein
MQSRRGSSYKLKLGCAGTIVGYFLAVAIAVGFFPDSPQAPIPFIFTVLPAVIIGFIIWGHQLDKRSKEERPGFDVIIPEKESPPKSD